MRHTMSNSAFPSSEPATRPGRGTASTATGTLALAHCADTQRTVSSASPKNKELTPLAHMASPLRCAGTATRTRTQVADAGRIRAESAVKGVLLPFYSLALPLLSFPFLSFFAPPPCGSRHRPRHQEHQEHQLVPDSSHTRRDKEQEGVCCATTAALQHCPPPPPPPSSLPPLSAATPRLSCLRRPKHALPSPSLILPALAGHPLHATRSLARCPARFCVAWTWRGAALCCTAQTGSMVSCAQRLRHSHACMPIGLSNWLRCA